MSRRRSTPVLLRDGCSKFFFVFSCAIEISIRLPARKLNSWKQPPFNLLVGHYHALPK